MSFFIMMMFLRMIFLAILSGPAVVANGTREEMPQEQQAFDKGIADCAAIQAVIDPDGTVLYDLRGHVTFRGPIHCSKPTVRKQETNAGRFSVDCWRS